MENIINFPTKIVRDWTVIERALREALQNGGVSVSVQPRILERMKAFYDETQCEFHIEIPIAPEALPKDMISSVIADLSEKIRVSLSEQIHAFTNKLLIERLNREIDSCREVGLL